MLKHIFMLIIALVPVAASGQTGPASVLVDRNDDGVVSVLAFGDSITFGVGDGVEPGEFVEIAPQTDGRVGYPLRVEGLYGISVENRGIPGEELAKGGVERFVSVVSASKADVVVILEGFNDSLFRVDRGTYSRLLQKLINATVALGRTPVLATLQTPCCNHAGREPFIDSYSSVVQELAFINDLRVADLDRAWRTTCRNKVECELFNLPEGLHPNKRGYDVMAQTILAALLGIDVFAIDGASQLEGALGLPAGSVLVKPEVAS